MGIRRTMAAGGLAVVLVVAGAGCGKAAETLAEKASGCEDIDASGDEVGAECDGVSAGVDAEGNVAVTDQDGNSTDLSGQGDGTLPEGWPSDLALPEGASIVASNVTQDPKAFTVIAAADGDPTAIYEDLRTQMEGAGYTIDSDSSSDAGGGAFSTLTASGPDYDASLSVAEGVGAGQEADLGSVNITWTLTEVVG